MKTVTLWGRLCEFSNKNNKKLPSLEDKRQLGIKVLEVWFAQEKRPHIYKRKTREGKFINMVWCYPESFAPVIDKIIEEYYSIHPELNNHEKNIMVPRESFRLQNRRNIDQIGL